jgi:hypothetical protein
MRDVLRSFRKDWRRWTLPERLGALAAVGGAVALLHHLTGLAP